MDVVLLAARLLLGGVFALAGVSKLREPIRTRQMVVDFGVPADLSSSVAFVLPLIEIAVAAGVLGQPTAAYSAAVSLFLLVVFVGAILYNLARGRRPECRCFGQIASSPVGWQAVVRNGALAAVAGFVAVVGWTDPGPSFFAWMLPLSAFERAMVVVGVGALVLLTLNAVSLGRLVRQNQLLLDRLPASSAAVSATVPASDGLPTLPEVAGLAVDTPAPSFALPTLRGDSITLSHLRRLGKPIVLIFSDPACGPCTALLPDVGRWQNAYMDSLVVVLVSRGDVDVNRAGAKDAGLTWVLLQREREVAEAYQVVGTPSAVLIRQDGTIGTYLAQGEGAIRRLIAAQVGTSASAPWALSFTLPDLSGSPVSLHDFRGRSTLVLFWSPRCGFCQRMLPDLRAWESQPESERPRLLVVSGGSVEENQAMGLRAIIVLDQDQTVARYYGAQGTPSAALVDAEGHLAKAVAVGAADIFALVGYSPDEGSTPSPILEQTIGGVRVAPPAAFPTDARPVKHDCVEDELLSDGNIVLYNSCRNQVLTLNGTAALIWEYCDGEHSVSDIVAELRDIFPDASTAERDVQALLDSLIQASMVHPATSSPVAVRREVRA